MATATTADVKFVRMMIKHHQVAVDESAKAYHDKQTTQDVKEWAKDIWNGQKKEIEKWTKWLKDRGYSASGGGMSM